MHVVWSISPYDACLSEPVGYGTVAMNVQRIIKRWIDALVSVILLIVLSPVMGVISVIVRTTMGSPVLFKQTRLGFKGEPFDLLKFRTMTEDKDDDGNYLPDEARITRFGRSLRSTSLDELPELVNVLRGEMSIVGPRPLLPRYQERYSPDEWRRHEMPPGMAGPVMARGRNALNWKEKFYWDTWYVDNWSLWLDVKIFFQSIVKALTGYGVSPEGRATMEEFLGHGAGDGEDE